MNEQKKKTWHSFTLNCTDLSDAQIALIEHSLNGLADVLEKAYIKFEPGADGAIVTRDGGEA